MYWIFGDNSQKIFTGINLFMPFFLLVLVSFYMVRQRIYTVLISIFPFIIMFSRSALVVLGLIYVTMKTRHKGAVYIVLVFSIFFFYYWSFMHHPEILRGRESILSEILSYKNFFIVGIGPGVMNDLIESSLGYGSLHNIILEIFISYGILGLSFFTYFLFKIFRQSHPRSLTTGLSVFFGFGLFSFNLGGIGFFVICALLSKLEISSNFLDVKKKVAAW